METMTLQLMDTEIYIGVQFEQPVDWQPVMSEWFHYVAKQWSRFHEGNELYAINALLIGQTMQLRAPLYRCLQLAHYYFEQTDGYFSPYLKKHIEAHGYNKTFAQLKAASTPIPPVSPASLRFCRNGFIQKISDAEIDVGGIAKGFTAFYASELLQSLGSTAFDIVDVGGDMQLWSHTDKVWSIGIAHPHDDTKTIATLSIQNGGIATSSKVKRSWANGDKHHILNGQSGHVATGDKLQVTAVAKYAYLAEVAAKTSFFTEAANDYFHNVPRYVVTTNGYYAE